MNQSHRSQAPPGKGDSEAVLRALRDLRAGVDPEGSFRVLVETYDPVVKAFFARRLKSADECLDLTQETFLRVYKGLKGYRGDAPFGAWLFRIAWNVLHRRAADPRASASVILEPQALEAAQARAEAQSPAENPSAYRSVLRKEQRAVLWRAIAKLPPQRRRCLTLWARQELSYEQIAKVMRLSLGTVKAHLAQARAQLEELVRSEEAAAADETVRSSDE